MDIGKGEHLGPDFLRNSPHNQIPVIVDSNGPDAGAPEMHRRQRPASFPTGRAARVATQASTASIYA